MLRSSKKPERPNNGRSPGEYLKRTLLLFCAALLLQSCGFRSAVRKTGYDFSTVRKVAVLDFADAPGSQGSGQLMSDLMEKNLLKAGFAVVDRASLRKLIDSKDLAKESFLGRGGLSSLKASAGIDAVLSGRLEKAVQEQYFYRSDVTSFIAAQAEVQCELVGIDKGEVLWSAAGSYDAMNLQTAFEYVSGSMIKRLVKDTGYGK